MAESQRTKPRLSKAQIRTITRDYGAPLQTKQTHGNIHAQKRNHLYAKETTSKTTVNKPQLTQSHEINGSNNKSQHTPCDIERIRSSAGPPGGRAVTGRCAVAVVALGSVAAIVGAIVSVVVVAPGCAVFKRAVGRPG